MIVVVAATGSLVAVLHFYYAELRNRVESLIFPETAHRLRSVKSRSSFRQIVMASCGISRAVSRGQ
jgi:hypothetical protein